VLNQEVVRFLKLPATQNQISALSSEPVGSTPQAFSAAIKAEVARMSKVIKDAGIREE
jgi:tripartite-type tricarboxylate transporter receptor subunit TctC